MLHTMAQFLGAPWVLPCVIGLAAFALGLLIPKKNGANWFSAIVFFPVNLFLDMLDMVHTKKFKYYGLILALLAIEAFFAFRASTVYYDVLHSRMPGPEMTIVCVIVFIAVFLCGYMVATHGKLTFWSFWTMVFVIMHDWAGTVWMNYSTPDAASTNAQLKVVLTIGMCVLGLLPFIMGAWTEELRPQLDAEMEEEVNAFTSTATRKIKRRAVDRVLRLANHTNVVHLVRALPADEFADFKKFVMPIIAPGTPYNLTDQPSNDLSETAQIEGQKSVKMIEQKPSKSRQNDRAKTVKMSDQPLSFDQSNEGSPDRQNEKVHALKMTRKNLSDDSSNETSKKPSKNALRDARIRQYAAGHDMTQAQLARHFKVSISTIARALISGKPSMNEEISTEPDTERNTDKIETLVIPEEEMALARA